MGSDVVSVVKLVDVLLRCLFLSSYILCVLRKF